MPFYDYYVLFAYTYLVLQIVIHIAFIIFVSIIELFVSKLIVHHAT